MCTSFPPFDSGCQADVEKTLPPKREIKLLIGMTEKQQEFYKSILEKNLEVLNSFASKTSKTQLQNIVMQLRKCANHPSLFEGFEQPPFVNDERLIQEEATPPIPIGRVAGIG